MSGPARGEQHTAGDQAGAADAALAVDGEHLTTAAAAAAATTQALVKVVNQGP